MFHNTINEVDKISLFEAHANNQEQKIHEFFRATKEALTPTEVWERCFNCSVPITSVRRGMSNLTKIGILRKTLTKRQGLYGMDNYCWILNYGI